MVTRKKNRQIFIFYICIVDKPIRLASYDKRTRHYVPKQFLVFFFVTFFSLSNSIRTKREQKKQILMFCNHFRALFHSLTLSLSYSSRIDEVHKIAYSKRVTTKKPVIQISRQISLPPSNVMIQIEINVTN